MDKKFYITLLRVAMPIIAQELIYAFVNILDTFMIGSLGVHEITAVGLANQLFFLFIIFTFGICSGSSILMGQFWGAEDVPSIKKTMGICLCASIAIAVLFSCFALFAPRLVMEVYSKDVRVIELGSEYLSVIWLSYVLSSIGITFTTALKSMRQTKAPMFTAVIALCVNACLNYVFIFKLDMGVKGAALATVIARAVELAAIISITYGMRFPIAPKLRELFTADLDFVKHFAFITVPVVLNESTWALGTTLYNVAYRFCGTEAQGALQISDSVQRLFMVLGMGIGSACGIMIANTLGAGKIDKAIAYSRKFMKLSVGFGIASGILLAVASPFVVNLFNVSDEVKGYAVRTMLVLSCVAFTKFFNFTAVVGILRSGGDTWFCFIMDLVFVWLVGLPLAFLGAAVFNLPVYWVCALASMDEASKIFVSGGRVLKNGWAKRLV